MVSVSGEERDGWMDGLRGQASFVRIFSRPDMFFGDVLKAFVGR